jgi:hypothetical protein
MEQDMKRAKSRYRVKLESVLRACRIITPGDVLPAGVRSSLHSIHDGNTWII